MLNPSEPGTFTVLNIGKIFLGLNVLIIFLPLTLLFVEWRRTHKPEEIVVFFLLMTLGAVEFIFNPVGQVFNKSIPPPSTVFYILNIIIFVSIFIASLYRDIRAESGLLNVVNISNIAIAISAIGTLYLDLIDSQIHELMLILLRMGVAALLIYLVVKLGHLESVLLMAIIISWTASIIFHTIFFSVFYTLLAFFIIKDTLRDIKILDAANQRLKHEKKVTFDLINEIGNEVREINKHEEILQLVLRSSIKTTESEAGGVFFCSNTNAKHDQIGIVLSIMQGPFISLESEKEKTLFGKTFERQLYEKSGATIGRKIMDMVIRANGGIILQRKHESEIVEKLGESAYHIRNLCAVPLKIKFDLLGLLVVINKGDLESEYVNEDLSLLQSLGDQAALGINNARMYARLSESERMQRELEIATEIQLSLLPKEIPRISNFECAANITPAKEVGGDYYDVIRLDDNRMGLIIGDVSGKGVPAGMVMLMARTILHVILRDLSSPFEIISNLSKHIYNQMDSRQFMTLLYLVWDREKNRLDYSSAGHEHILVFRHEKKKVDRIRSGGLAIGMHADIEQFIEEKSIPLEKGDAVVLYTDGVTEARNETGEMYTLDRLQRIIEENGHLGIEELRGKIIEDVDEFRHGYEQYDDITLLTFKVS
jgi:serine phosphatase RsbU (regulator of sigma subunit)